ncbi:MAG: hypothetical protein LBB88_03275 [Planctomycetaceae bacterium]|nr:hypothetical protein [Planctomycetaceae bacterium]
MNSYKLTNVETQCLASLLFDQKLTDRDANHCVSTVGLAIQNGNCSHAIEKNPTP